MNSSNKIVFFLLWTSSLIFGVFILMLAFNVRLPGDDLILLIDFTKDGWLDSVVNFRSNVRWTSILLCNTIFLPNKNLATIHWNLIVYYFVLFSALVSVFSFFLRTILLRFDKALLSLKDRVLLAFLFCITLFFSTSAISEVWFWMSASTIYLVPILFFVLGFSHLLSKKNTLLTYLIISISFLYIGGAVENFALITLFLLLSLFVISFKKNKYVELKSIRGKIILGIAALLVFLIKNLAGSKIRHRFHYEMASEYNVRQNEIGRIVDKIVEPSNVIVILCLLIAVILGAIYRERGLSFFKFKLRRIVIISGILLAIIMCITFSPLFFTFHNLGPERAWFPFNFFLTLFLFSFAFYIGNVSEIRWVNFVPFRYIVSISIVVLISVYLFRQYSIVTNYSHQYDQRIERLTKLKKMGNKKPAYCKPMPDSGMVIKAELDEKGQGKESVGFRYLLNLNFEVCLEKSKKDAKRN